MAALAISNDALRDSLRPVSPPSIHGWLAKQANPWWRHVEYVYSEAAYWLWARAPWQRWTISGGLGALLGVAIVVVALPRFRPDLEGVAAASGEGMLAVTQLAAASAVVIAPLRQGVPPTMTVDAVKGPAPAADAVQAPDVATDGLAVAEPDAPTAVEVSEQVVEDPAAAAEPSKSKKKKKARKHGKRRATKPKASQLSQLFKSMHRSSRASAER
jgi:hypothetical protein